MKKICICLLILLSSLPFISKTIFKTSQTFMFTRPAYQNVGAYFHLWKKIIADTESPDYALQALFLHQHSICNKHTDQFFLLHCQNVLSVAGDATDPSLLNTRDIRAEWLGLPSTFSGKFTVHPSQEQTFVQIVVKKNLYFWFPYNFFKTWWVSLSIPFVHVRNNLHFTTFDTQNPGTGFPHNLTDAFTQPAWCFGKMDHRSRTKNRLAEIRFTLGNVFLNHDDFLLASYSALSFPLAKKQRPNFIFSPFGGANGHIDWVFGFLLELPCYEDCPAIKSIFFATLENHFLLKNHQWRALDIRHPIGTHNEYSRYLLLRLPNDPTTVPAVNIFTERVQVRPFNIVDLATGFRFEKDAFNVEAGYHLWAHQSEQIKLLRSNCEGTRPLIEQFGIAGSGTGSASQSSINQQVDDPSGQFVTLLRDHLDLSSGASRGGFTQGAYIALGYLYEGVKHRYFGSLGVFYDKPNTNTALEYWAVWVKFGGEF
ncbi:MAG: hypothetical protein WA432_04930 [Candidatus Babeliaceae bacterium]